MLWRSQIWRYTLQSNHCYILEGEKILKSLRKKYPGISRLDDGDQERRIVGFDVLATGFTLTEIGL